MSIVLKLRDLRVKRTSDYLQFTMALRRDEADVTVKSEPADVKDVHDKAVVVSAFSYVACKPGKKACLREALTAAGVKFNYLGKQGRPNMVWFLLDGIGEEVLGLVTQALEAAGHNVEVEDALDDKPILVALPQTALLEA